MDKGLIAAIVESIIRVLPVGVVKNGLDRFIDFVEDAVAKSKTPIDDVIVLPLLKALRGQLGIEETPGSGFEDKPISITTTGDVTVTEKP